ncbi:MAG TPA: hypothetical protein VIN11_00905 [Roseivirga sp.]
MDSEELNRLKEEYEENLKSYNRLKKLIPLGVPLGVCFSFVYPYIPLRNGPLVENLAYSDAVIIMHLVFFGIYYWGYQSARRKRRHSITHLKIQIQELQQNLEQMAKKPSSDRLNS